MPKDLPPKSLESWIWDAACSIRGAKDAPKYKDYILPLIFTKRLCDVFDDELNRIAAKVGSRRERLQTCEFGSQTGAVLSATEAGKYRGSSLVGHPQAVGQDRRSRHHPHAGHRA